MRALMVAAATALLACGMSPPARAEPLRICFEEWQPYAMVVDGKPAGLMILIMDRALAMAGETAIYSQQPYARCLENVRSGVYDAVLMTSDEEGLVPTSVSVAFWEVGVIAGPRWPRDHFASLNDFDGATVGLVKSYIYPPAVTEASARWKVQFATEALFNLRKASSGRIDLTIADVHWTHIQRARENLQLRIMQPSLFAWPQYTYFNPSKARVEARVDEALHALVADGTVDRLYQQVVQTSFQSARERAATALFPD